MSVDYFLKNMTMYSRNKERLIIETYDGVIYDGKFDDLPITLYFKIREMRVSFETSCREYEKIEIRY